MQSFQELEENPDIKKLLLQKILERREKSIKEGDIVSMEEFDKKVNKWMKERHEPATWKNPWINHFFH